LGREKPRVRGPDPGSGESKPRLMLPKPGFDRAQQRLTRRQQRLACCQPRFSSAQPGLESPKPGLMRNKPRNWPPAHGTILATLLQFLFRPLLFLPKHQLLATFKPPPTSKKQFPLADGIC
jgi:hypothetical protein